MPKAMPATTHASAVAASTVASRWISPTRGSIPAGAIASSIRTPRGRDKEPQKPAAEREHQTFREQLSHEPRPLRANRRTNADLVLPRRRAH